MFVVHRQLILAYLGHRIMVVYSSSRRPLFEADQSLLAACSFAAVRFQLLAVAFEGCAGSHGEFHCPLLIFGDAFRHLSTVGILSGVLDTSQGILLVALFLESLLLELAVFLQP